LLGRDLALGEAAQGGQQGLACGLEGVGRPGGGGCRVVDLVRETGGERAEGDQGGALPRRRLDGARGVVQALDEMLAEGEPGIEPVAQYVRRHPEHPPVSRSPAGREVDAVFVPGAEPAGPAAGHVHLPDHSVLAADVVHQVHGTVNEHPPIVRALALVKQLDAGLDTNLGTAPGQFRQLVVGQPVEQAERAKLVGAHQIVAR